MAFVHENGTPYRCRQCGDRVDIPWLSSPQVEIEAVAGGRNYRVLRHEGAEVHRCPCWPESSRSYDLKG
jgi:hypothetical protein